MYICLCTGVTEEQWRDALREAENDWLAASAATGAGQVCGGCRVFLSASTLDLPVIGGQDSPSPAPCPPPVLTNQSA